MIHAQQLQQAVQTHRHPVSLLLKRYKIKRPVSAEAILEGSQRYGQRFLIDLYAILRSPAQPAGRSPSGFFAPGASLAAAGEELGSGSSTGNVWDFLSQLVNTAGTVWSNYQGAGAVPTYTPAPQPANLGGMDTNKILIYGLGAVVVVLLAVMIFKKL